MRGFWARMLVVAAVLVPSVGMAQDMIPERRVILSRDTDLPGGDISSIFDTTLEACERACLTNQSCQAFTFNTRNGSCFPKSSASGEVFFQGAYSGRVAAADPAVLAAAADRRAELSFLQDWDIQAAYTQAATLGDAHVTGTATAEELLLSAMDAEASGDLDLAAQFTGAALNITDDAETWAEYARRYLQAGIDNRNENQSFQFDRALNGAINAYLRADKPALRHTILVTLGDVLERLGRGRETVQALRLAQSLQPREDTALLLDDAIGKYGFRIVENTVESDLARPRLCASFSEPLVASGIDYASFVQLTEPGLTVALNGTQQLCVEGVMHGSRYSVTFREGLPAADGQMLAKSVAITQYVRDRNPGVRFPGRGYILPRSDDAGIPVDTVNTERLDLTLFAVSDRNILRAIQDSYFGTPMPEYQEGTFTDAIGDKIWSGTATVGQKVNKDVTTRLPMGEAIAGLPAGIYALKAAVPGVDPYVVPAGWQWFVISDLGVTTMSGGDGLHVFVRSLATAGAKTGVTVELLSRANAVLGAATTDDQGYARFDAGLSRGLGSAAPAMVVVREGGADMAFLSLTDPAFDLSDRGVEGREAAPPVDVFLTTDRGAYRTGEVVYATALARDATAAAVSGLPLTAVLLRPDGVEYSRQLVADAGAGGHVFQMPIAGSAPRGVWRLEVLADLEAPALTSRTFLVEDFLPERIDFDLALQGPPLALAVTTDALPEVKVAARYLFGAPGADLAIEGEVLLRAAEGLAAWPGYAFGRHDQPFNAVMQSLEPTVTDAAGEARAFVMLPEVDDPGRPLEARVTLRVAEGSGRPVERQIIQPLAPSSPMIGVKPLFADVVPEGAEARFSLIGVGADEALVPMAVNWEIVRIETDYQWYQSYGNWNWEPVTRRSRVAEGTVSLGDAPVEIAAPVQWGE
ncbi:MAG: MG2 domain-containing protein, partial [Pseudomonadota bacterium]